MNGASRVRISDTPTGGASVRAVQKRRRVRHNKSMDNADDIARRRGVRGYGLGGVHLV